MKRVLIAMCSYLMVSLVWADSLVVYSGRGEALVGPLYAQFEKETGIKLDVRYNATSAAATQLLHEAKESPADVVFFQEAGQLSALAEAGLLHPLSDELLQLVDQKYRDDKGYWVGTSARLRVLVYNTDKLDPSQLPKDLRALTDSTWKGVVGWAPTNASAIAHFHTLEHLWGKEKAQAWFDGMSANAAVRYARNSQIVRAVANGEIDLGWTNHYYALRLKKQNPKLPVANYSFPQGGEAGNLLIVSGVGITAHSTKKAQAEALIRFLLNNNAQNYFSQDNFEYPTRPELVKIVPAKKLSEVPLSPVGHIQGSSLMNTVEFLRENKLL